MSNTHTRSSLVNVHTLQSRAYSLDAKICARPRVRLNPQFRRWKYLIGDSIRLMSADVARTVTLQGDIIILGRVFPGLGSVGHYVYGNSISRQSMMLFSRNLDLVLFPTLSRSDQERSIEALFRALESTSG